MKIHNHKVIFGEVRDEWASDCGAIQYYNKVQRWDIPSLRLHGFVCVKTYRKKPLPLNDIIRNIENEVDFDLGERKKKALGIYQ